MKDEILQSLRNVVGEEYVITELQEKLRYLYDEVNEKIRPKANEDSVLVFPNNTSEVAQICRLAYESNIVIVARGAGTGLSGGAVPTHKSIIISTERLNKIEEVDRENMMVTLGAGVTLESLYIEMDKHEGIWFPAHPAFDTASLGGIAATNGGGARAIRHGIMRRHVVGMEVVLPNGEILNLGGKLIKDNAGFNLMHLIIGSEGALAIITKLILRIYPEDKFNGSIACAFETLEEASRASLKIVESGITPLAIEYQDRHLFIGGAEVLNKKHNKNAKWPLTKGKSDLMIVVSESEKTQYESVVKKIMDIVVANNCVETFETNDKLLAKELIDIRSHYYYYVKSNLSHFFDMTVPAASIPQFFKDLNSLFAEYGTTTNMCAHIADGNLHNEIMLGSNGEVVPYAEELKEKMYKVCLSYGGTITGEHGVGKLRTKELQELKPVEVEIMRKIKFAFDPKGLLNPGNVLTEV